MDKKKKKKIFDPNVDRYVLCSRGFKKTTTFGEAILWGIRLKARGISLFIHYLSICRFLFLSGLAVLGPDISRYRFWDFAEEKSRREFAEKRGMTSGEV